MMNSNHLAVNVSLKNSLGILVLAALLFSFTPNTQAQEAVSLEQFLSKKSNDNVDVVSDFVFENVPTTIWKQGGLVSENSPNAQKLITDVPSIRTLVGQNQQNRSVKFLQINVEGSQEKAQVRLNPEVLSVFVNLQYVFVQSQVALTSNEVEAMVSGYEEGDVIVLFQVVSNF